MIIVNAQGIKYRPGEDSILDEDIFPTFNFNQDNYIPSRAELMEDLVDTNI